MIGELRSRGATVIMATHLVDRGRALCDQALLLEEGRLAWSGPAAECRPRRRAGAQHLVSPFAAALRKDLLLQWRTRGQLVAVFVFGASALLLFSFAIGPNAAALREFAAGFLWLALLLASTLALADSFESEMKERALEGLLLLPADPRALYYGKAVANLLQLALLGVGPRAGDGGALRRRHGPAAGAPRRDRRWARPASRRPGRSTPR